uniref:Uncharacterized protein n=1 Tax=Arion vulgaris TaxID=1028688 RepID=A0A0B7AWT9_9EUPU
MHLYCAVLLSIIGQSGVTHSAFTSEWSKTSYGLNSCKRHTTHKERNSTTYFLHTWIYKCCMAYI